MITNTGIIKEYYEALVKRDPTYLGRYYAAVKTTGIFCLSTCYARKPKFENVDFYSDREAVKAAGYRACKLCKPERDY